ncbi:MAG: prolyl oligopeptidase family serine peptidase [Bacteroidales bacterium]|nr:prolyl oligopeptidase family serine peptidase [Bacteroidales bacterium]
MKKIVLLIFISVLTFNLKICSQTHNPFFEGFWYGLLEFQGTELILTFELKNESDSLSGSLNSPLQGANEIPITKIIVKEDSLHIFIKSMSANFKGKLLEQDSIIDGIFSQAIFKIPVKFKKTQELFVLNRPQEPHPPFSYIEEEVEFENPTAQIKLAGTLTYPKGDSTFPTVVLISGSGPQNRNEEILEHKPFLIIADYFSTRGIAVLRFDDRGVGNSGGVFSTATSMDFATDVEAAVAFLRQHPRVDTSHIGLIGHSEGGMIAPIVASNDRSIAFIILLAGPGLTGEQVLLTQIEKMLVLDNVEASIIKAIIKDSKKVYKILINEPDYRKAANKIKKYYTKRAKKISEDLHLLYGYTSQGIESKIMAMNSSWFRYFIKFNPEDYLRRVECPVLAIFGEKDVQVLAAQNLEAIEKIILKYGKRNFTTKLYPDKNHLFQNATKGSILEYAMIEETISTDVLEDLLFWIKQRE